MFDRVSAKAPCCLINESDDQHSVALIVRKLLPGLREGIELALPDLVEDPFEHSKAGFDRQGYEGARAGEDDRNVAAGDVVKGPMAFMHGSIVKDDDMRCPPARLISVEGGHQVHKVAKEDVLVIGPVEERPPMLTILTDGTKKSQAVESAHEWLEPEELILLDPAELPRAVAVETCLINVDELLALLHRLDHLDAEVAALNDVGRLVEIGLVQPYPLPP